MYWKAYGTARRTPRAYTALVTVAAARYLPLDVHPETAVLAIFVEIADCRAAKPQSARLWVACTAAMGCRMSDGLLLRTSPSGRPTGYLTFVHCVLSLRLACTIWEEAVLEWQKVPTDHARSSEHRARRTSLMGDLSLTFRPLPPLSQSLSRYASTRFLCFLKVHGHHRHHSDLHCASMLAPTTDPTWMCPAAEWLPKEEARRDVLFTDPSRSTGVKGASFTPSGGLIYTA